MWLVTEVVHLCQKMSHFEALSSFSLELFVNWCLLSSCINQAKQLVQFRHYLEHCVDNDCMLQTFLLVVLVSLVVQVLRKDLLLMDQGHHKQNDN